MKKVISTYYIFNRKTFNLKLKDQAFGHRVCIYLLILVTRIVEQNSPYSKAQVLCTTSLYVGWVELLAAH